MSPAHFVLYQQSMCLRENKCVQISCVFAFSLLRLSHLYFHHRPKRFRDDEEEEKKNLFLVWNREKSAENERSFFLRRRSLLLSDSSSSVFARPRFWWKINVVAVPNIIRQRERREKALPLLLLLFKF